MNGLRVIESQGGLVATGLGKRFKKRPVVRNVSISVKRGEAVGLLGPNGAGKTTTLSMITGEIQPTDGHCVVANLDTRKHMRDAFDQMGFA